MRVWMVHEEDGMYSDWRFNVAGVFSAYEKAEEYVLSQRRKATESGKTWYPCMDEPAVYVGPERADLESCGTKVPCSSWRLGDEGWFITEMDIDRQATVTRDWGLSFDWPMGGA